MLYSCTSLWLWNSFWEEMLYHHCPLGRAVCTWHLQGFVSACYLPVISSVLQFGSSLLSERNCPRCSVWLHGDSICHWNLQLSCRLTGADTVRAMELCSEQNQWDHELGGWSFSALWSHCFPPFFFHIHTNMRGGVHMHTRMSKKKAKNVANKRFSVCAFGKKPADC